LAARPCKAQQLAPRQSATGNAARRINWQYCRRDVANANIFLYLTFAAAPADFIGVTLGNNQFGGTTPPYDAKPGYDNATGLGMPLGMALTTTACPSHTPASIGRAIVTAQSGRRHEQHRLPQLPGATRI
jgi:hypothetical protein